MSNKADRERVALFVGTDEDIPPGLQALFSAMQLRCHVVPSGDMAVATALRSAPELVLVDGRRNAEARGVALSACERIKADSFSGMVPVIALSHHPDTALFFEAGADEVFTEDNSADDYAIRIPAALRRHERDTDIHPSTRLPGTRRINAELTRHIASGEIFSVCYVDLDHFKEFNDRYGWHNGDRIIQLLARILHDVVKGLCGDQGFIGHIGGDDFLCIVPLAAMSRVCDEIILVFEELIPLQYSEQDRRAGYFFGKDRRGQLHRVPLMTLSIGVATNQRRRYSLPADISEVASEMKSYAKTLNGSVWAVDRRRDDELPTSSMIGTEKSSPSPRIGQRR